MKLPRALKMAVHSKPEALDKAERRLFELKIAQEALKKEEDAESKTLKKNRGRATKP